ncbi:hypothetical protein [Engelhardtia mirabilis]|uniref:Right handed beta helix domain-containing protein n=1 Tax=Engelhardtia mirabilis TaxID=2528011 RepID=A0A518BRI7_9BACT|nr:hypothetical protein Pla133_46960 [Planctomycetes bacterium Pla133]QDV03902.1 hypothetical protein Pla86_46940 [Planctomycetes bacterium Pla86]
MLTLAGLLLLPAAVPKVITVDDSGGADHVAIQDAVEAADWGDTILIDSGTYSSFTVSSTALTVAARKGAVVDLIGTVAVLDIGADDQVLLCGLRAQGSGGQPALRVESCDGSIIIDGSLFIAQLAPTSLKPWDPVAGRIRDCAAISLIDTTFFGADSNKAFSDQPAGAGLIAVDAQMHLANTFAQGGRGSNAKPNHAASEGGAGIVLDGGVCHLQGSHLFGGNGGNGLSSAPSCSGADGGDALTSVGAQVFYRATDFYPGNGGNGALEGCGSGPDGNEIAPVGGWIEELPGTGFALDAGPSPAIEGQWLQFKCSAQPFDLVVLAWGSAPDFSTVPGLDGLRLVGEPLKFVSLGLIPPSGSISIGLPAPQLGPGFEAMTLYFQLLSSNPLSPLNVLGENAVIVVLDSDV